MSEQNNRPYKNPCANEVESLKAWTDYYNGVNTDDALVKVCREIHECTFKGEVTPAVKRVSAGQATFVCATTVC